MVGAKLGGRSMKTGKWLRIAVLMGPLVLSGCSEFGSARYEESGLTASSHAMGVHYYGAGQYGLAVQHFQRAAERSPGAVDSLNGLAAAYDRLGRFDLAERYYRRALAFNREDPQTLNNLGYSYWLQGRYDLALVYLREAEVLDPASETISTNLARALDDYQRDGALAAVMEEEPEEPDEAEKSVRQTWIERSAPDEQKLITRPALNLLAVAKKSQLDPQWLSYGQADQEPPVSYLDELADSSGILPEGGTAEAPAAAPVQKVTSAPLETRAEAPRPVSLFGPQVASDQAFRFDGQPVGLTEALTAGPGDLRELTEGLSRPSDAQRVGAAPQLAAATDGSSDRQAAAATPQLQEIAATVPQIEVLNGVGVRGMAGRMRDYIEARGLSVEQVSDAKEFGRATTTVYYRDEWRVYAMGLASMLPADVRMEASKEGSADIWIELGDDLQNFDRRLSASRGPLRDDDAG